MEEELNLHDDFQDICNANHQRRARIRRMHERAARIRLQRLLLYGALACGVGTIVSAVFGWLGIVAYWLAKAVHILLAGGCCFLSGWLFGVAK